MWGGIHAYVACGPSWWELPGEAGCFQHLRIIGNKRTTATAGDRPFPPDALAAFGGDVDDDGHLARKVREREGGPEGGGGVMDPLAETASACDASNTSYVTIHIDRCLRTVGDEL